MRSNRVRAMKAKKKVTKKKAGRPKKEKYSFPKNIKWCANFDYDDGSKFGCDCPPDDYHRCATVTNVRISNIDYEEIFRDICGHKDIRNIKDYCLDRGIRRIISLDSFEGYGVAGYYGEELVREFTATEELTEFISFLLKASDTKAIERALMLEYGFVLDSIKNKKWKMIDKVPVECISYGDHYKKVDLETVEKYKMSKNNSCLCRGGPNKFKLIDGYHRLAAVKQSDKKNKIMKVIACD